MAKKIGFWESIAYPERVRQQEYEAKQNYISPQEKFWYQEYKRQNPEVDISMIDSEFDAREAKRKFPNSGKMEEEEGGNLEIGSKPGSWSRKKAKKKKDPAKTEESIWKRMKDLAKMEYGEDYTLENVKSMRDEARKMIEPTDEEKEMDRLEELDKTTAQTGLYNEESQNPAMAGITPGMPGAGFEGAPMPGSMNPMMMGANVGMNVGQLPQMPGMAPTQAQVTQPPQNIKLPEGIKTTSEAFKFLTTEQGMSEEDAKSYLRSLLKG